MTDLQAAIVMPEERVHFAGEHCSLYHAWTRGRAGERDSCGERSARSRRGDGGRVHTRLQTGLSDNERTVIVRRLTFMHDNIHSGVGVDRRYDLGRIRRVLAAERPHVAALQEIECREPEDIV